MSLADRIIVMDHGRIAQTGTPREIYARPATRFVGDFIGTMNRIPGCVQGGAFVCVAGAVTGISLLQDCKEVLFRPEAVTLAEPDTGGLVGQVHSVAYMGNCTRLLIDGFGGPPLIVEFSDEREFGIGQSVSVHIRPSALMTLAGA